MCVRQLFVRSISTSWVSTATMNTTLQKNVVRKKKRKRRPPPLPLSLIPTHTHTQWHVADTRFVSHVTSFFHISSSCSSSSVSCWCRCCACSCPSLSLFFLLLFLSLLSLSFFFFFLWCYHKYSLSSFPVLHPLLLFSFFFLLLQMLAGDARHSNESFCPPWGRTYAKKEQATQIWKCRAFTVRKNQWPHTSKCV